MRQACISFVVLQFLQASQLASGNGAGLEMVKWTSLALDVEMVSIANTSESNGARHGPRNRNIIGIPRHHRICPKGIEDILRDTLANIFARLPVCVSQRNKTQ